MIPSTVLRVLTLSTLAVALAGCAQPGAAPLSWDARSRPPSIEPLMIDGRCTLVVSASPTLNGKAIGHVGLDVEEGVAQIAVDLARPDASGATSFHVVVPVEEQHVTVIFIGTPRYPVWEKAAGGKDCRS